MASAMPLGDPLTRVPRYHTNTQLEETSGNAGAGSLGVVQSSHDQKWPPSDATRSLGAPLKRTRHLAPLAVGDTANHKSSTAHSRAPLPLTQKHRNSLNARPPRSARHAANDDPNHSWTLQDSAALSCKIGPAPAPDARLQDPACHPSHCSATAPIADPQAAPAAIDSEDGTSETSETDEDERAQVARWAARVAELEAEIGRIRAEQQRAEDQARRERLQLQLQLSAPLPPLPASPSSARPSSSPKSRGLAFDKLSFLTKARRARAARFSPTSTASLRSTPSSSISPTSSLGASVYCQISAQDPMSRNFIEAGGRGQTDAPRGASNGTERHVTVRCKGSTLDLVVGVETTTVDILVACADQAAQPIDVTTSVLLEAYARIGLERRLRRYERIRDVLNSWDHDSQNALVVSTDTADVEPDLELTNVPQTDKPRKGFILPLYHAHRPGKWHKRYITLLEGGQLFLSKKEDPGPSDKDTVGLCHLSDFDIYIPTETQKRKQLRPPKKYCYAIKSQQKSTVFLSTENYIHFFCTENLQVAKEFYSCVHRWRSWYMVNRALQLHTTKKPAATVVREAEKPPQILPDQLSLPRKSINHVRVLDGHRVKVSADESPYAIGAFKPLIDLKRFDKPLDEFGSDWVPDTRRSIPSTKAAAASSGKPRSSGEHKRELVTRPEREHGAFAEGGLLGSAYDQRKQAQKEENRHTQMSDNPDASGPFTAGPSLLNGRRTSSNTASSSNTRPSVSSEPKSPERPEPPGWFPSAVEHSAKSRPAAPTNRPSTNSSSNTTSTTHRLQGSSQHHHQQQQFPVRPRTGVAPPQPLVNFEPTFVEPPQWARTGRGHGIKVPDGKPLVDFATGPAAPPGARAYESPPRNLIRRGESVRSSESLSSARTRRPTAGWGSGGGALADSGRAGRGYEPGYSHVVKIPGGDTGTRVRADTNMSGASASTTRSPPLPAATSDRSGWGRDPRGRSGTMA